MASMNKLVEDLKMVRDETMLQIHLGSKEAQDEWAALEKRWHSFKTKAELEKTATEFSGTLSQLGTELKHAYVRLRRAL
jgi:hypothetical protein